nr:hypothetical protein [Burkholderia sp. LMG 13014]
MLCVLRLSFDAVAHARDERPLAPSAKRQRVRQENQTNSGERGRRTRLRDGMDETDAGRNRCRHDRPLRIRKRNGEGDGMARQRGGVSNEAAIWTSLPVRLDAMRGLAVVVRDHRFFDARRAIDGQRIDEPVTRRHHLRDRRGERHHQDCDQSDQAAWLAETGDVHDARRGWLAMKVVDYATLKSRSGA